MSNAPISVTNTLKASPDFKLIAVAPDRHGQPLAPCGNDNQAMQKQAAAAEVVKRLEAVGGVREALDAARARSATMSPLEKQQAVLAVLQQLAHAQAEKALNPQQGRATQGGLKQKPDEIANPAVVSRVGGHELMAASAMSEDEQLEDPLDRLQQPTASALSKILGAKSEGEEAKGDASAATFKRAWADDSAMQDEKRRKLSEPAA